MKFSPVALFPLLAAASAVTLPARDAVPPTAPAHRLYTALAMTGSQRDSSTPTDSGLYYRTGAAQWIHFGPRVLGVTSIAVHPRNPAIVLVATADGVVRSTDGGQSWRKTTGWEVADVRSIVFDPRQPQHVYAATAWGPLRSSDGGATWQLAQKGLPRLYCQSIVVDTAGHVLLGTETGLFASTDAAQSWHPAGLSDMQVLRVAQSAADEQVFLAGTHAHGAWLSRDGAQTWKQIPGLPATANIYAAAADPLNRDNLAVGGWAVGICLSTDGGATWRDVTRGLPTGNVFALAFDPDHRGRLWASVFEKGAFYSDDAGGTWTADDLEGAYIFDFVFAEQPAESHGGGGA